MDEEFVAWPFPIVKPEAEWDEFDRDFIDLMRTAYAEGYRPRHRWCSAVEAESSSGRSVFLIFRGRSNGWEPLLADRGRAMPLGAQYGLPLGDCVCVCVRPPFRAAGHLALEWLRGRSLEAVLGDFLFVGGYPAGIELPSDVVCATPPV
jgi:hypothetical protein